MVPSFYLSNISPKNNSSHSCCAGISDLRLPGSGEPHVHLPADGAGHRAMVFSADLHRQLEWHPVEHDESVDLVHFQHGSAQCGERNVSRKEKNGFKKSFKKTFKIWN